VSPAATALRRASGHGGSSAGLVKAIGSANSAQASGTTLTVPVPAGGVASGHVLVLRSGSDFTNNAPTISDGRGNTYTTLRTAPASGNAFRASLIVGAVSTALLAGDVITVTYQAAVTNRVVAVDEFAGLVVPLVSGANGAAGSSTTPQTSVVTTAPQTLVVGMVVTNGPVTDSYTQPSGWQALSRDGTQPGASPYISVGGAYRVLSATNTVSYRPVLWVSTPWVDLMAWLKAA
jgi:hypothetical protein